MNSGRFKKGHTETRSQKAKRVNAMREAWKNNPRRHGMMDTKFYNTWRSMTTRCRGTAGKESIKKYKSSGIRVCKRWLDFRNFYEDMFPSYSEGLTIDRIGDSKIYSKETCKWSTQKEQANNRRNTVRVNGFTLEEWSQKLKVSYSTLRKRYYNGFKKGRMTLEQVLSDKKFTRKMNISRISIIRDEIKLL